MKKRAKSAKKIIADARETRLNDLVLLVRESIMRMGMNVPDRRPSLVLVSRQDAQGTDLQFSSIEVNGTRIEASWLVPTGQVFVNIARVA